VNVKEFAAGAAEGECCFLVLPSRQMTVGRFSRLLADEGLDLWRFGFLSGRVPLNGKVKVVKRMLVAGCAVRDLPRMQRRAKLCGVALLRLTSEGVQSCECS
jgi:hypothetical protein